MEHWVLGRRRKGSRCLDRAEQWLCEVGAALLKRVQRGRDLLLKERRGKDTPERKLERQPDPGRSRIKRSGTGADTVEAKDRAQAHPVS